MIMMSSGGVSFSLLLVVLLVAFELKAVSQASDKETLPGARNYTRVDVTVACAGATSLDAFPELKRRGFRTDINLRMPEERGANVEAEGDAVRAAGMRYIQLPFYATLTSIMDPADPKAGAFVEAFLEAVVDPANQPVYIHSAAAHRASGMWLIKRLRIDRWSVEKAVAEAEVIGITDVMREFALNYVKLHPRKQ
jgi:protein tyrosine phosphatase (PTP) superfamily phosphohydrolase (DUF442 family)